MFHYIEFPDEDLMEDIVKVHHPDIEKKLHAGMPQEILLDQAVRHAQEKAFHQRAHRLDTGPHRRAEYHPRIVESELPFLGTLLKKKEDTDLVAQLGQEPLRVHLE